MTVIQKHQFALISKQFPIVIHLGKIDIFNWNSFKIV